MGKPVTVSEFFAGDDHVANVEAEIREELDAHMALCVEQLLSQGHTIDEAQREARARFGNLERTVRACQRAQLGGRFAMKQLQWILIVVLAFSTVALGLRAQALSASAWTARAMAEAQVQAANAALSALQARAAETRVPVEHIVVGVGDGLLIRSDVEPRIDQHTEVQRDGQALFRDIGWVEVADRTRQEVERELTAKYSEFYKTPGQVYVLVEAP